MNLKGRSKNDFGKMYNEDLHNLYVLYSSPKHRVIKKNEMGCTHVMHGTDDICSPNLGSRTQKEEVT